MKKLMLTVIILSAVAIFPKDSHAYILNMTDFEGRPYNASVEVVNDNTNAITFNIQMEDTLADIRGFFFNYNGLLSSDFNIVGADVTDWDTSGNISNMGGGVNMNGTGEIFDIGVIFGTAGMSSDDLHSVSFTIYNATDLDIDGMIGLRITSAGDDREGSGKLLLTTQSTPEPASIFLFGTGLLGTFLRRKFI